MKPTSPKELSLPSPHASTFRTLCLFDHSSSQAHPQSLTNIDHYIEALNDHHSISFTDKDLHLHLKLPMLLDYLPLELRVDV
jgi:hypothetical protein